MADEVTVPMLPCRSLDDVLPFYASLGFEVTYQQARPNPYAVVRRGGIELHLFGMAGFDPAESYGSVIILVPDVEVLYASFVDGLRSAYRKPPRTGIPRLLRPRKKAGTAAGFSLIDPGGNWLRIYRLGSNETPADEDKDARGLARVLLTAARQGDSRGDEATAMSMLRAGLLRHADAPATERVPALVYLAELAARTGDETTARSALAEVTELTCDDEVRAGLADDLATADEIAHALS